MLTLSDYSQTCTASLYQLVTLYKAVTYQSLVNHFNT